MAIKLDSKEILGEYADMGYELLEFTDDVVTVNYKGKEIGIYAQGINIPTKETLQECCRQHQMTLAVVGLAQ